MSKLSNLINKVFSVEQIAKEDFPLQYAITEYDERRQTASYNLVVGSRTVKIDVTLFGKTPYKGELYHIKPRNKSELYIFNSKEELTELLTKEEFR